MTTATQAEVKSALNVIRAVADTIREVKSVPSGHLYAGLMGVMSLSQFEQVVGILTRGGMISNSGHVLTWIGPA
jgi:hypothetical protein